MTRAAYKTNPFVIYKANLLQEKNKHVICQFEVGVVFSCVVFEPIYGHSVSFRETGLLSLNILPKEVYIEKNTQLK